MDLVIKLEAVDARVRKPGANFIVRFTKNRSLFGDAAKPFEAHLNPETKKWTRYSEGRQDRDDEIRTLIASGVKRDDVMARFNLSKGQISKIVNRDQQLPLQRPANDNSGPTADENGAEATGKGPADDFPF